MIAHRWNTLGDIIALAYLRSSMPGGEMTGHENRGCSGGILLRADVGIVRVYWWGVRVIISGWRIRRMIFVRLNQGRFRQSNQIFNISNSVVLVTTLSLDRRHDGSGRGVHTPARGEHAAMMMQHIKDANIVSFTELEHGRVRILSMIDGGVGIGKRVHVSLRCDGEIGRA